jgi:predicted enzyme related to lactoylglutathione lyase
VARATIAVRGSRRALVDAIGRLGWVQIDCQDPIALATFWGEVLGLELDGHHLGDPPHYVALFSPPKQPVISFQRVPEAKSGKNRLHFDVLVGDLEEASTRVEALGGSKLTGEEHEEYGFRWRIVADPEGNEFCLILDQ